MNRNHRLFLAVMLGTLLALSAQAARVQVLDRVEIARQKVNGLKLSELSGLAWDADEALLYAVSDKGRLFHIRLAIEGGRIREAAPVWAAELEVPGVKRGGVNAEALALRHADNGVRGDSELVIALESGRIVRVTPQGRPLGELPAPPALRDPRIFRSKNNGIESIALDARHGILVAPQRPLQGAPDVLHTIHAADGAHWSFRAARGGASAIKAMETAHDGRLLVLERLKASVGDAAPSVLRRIDLDACAAQGVCDAEELAGTEGLGAADNFEGLARVAEDLYLIVSDDGFGARRPTLLVLLGIAPR